MTLPEDSIDKAAETLLTVARSIWGPEAPMGGESAVTVLSVPLGDAARAVRDKDQLDEYGRELGNLILTSVRMLDNAGLDVGDMLRLAALSQHRFVKRRNHVTSDQQAGS